MVEWTTACPDWERRIIAGESLITFPPLFTEEAARGLAVFKELHLKDVPGCPTYGQVGRQWQFDLVSHIFGSCDPETGRRLIREFFIMVGKKNDKALALDTPIPTPSGWTTMGEITPECEVFGTDGRPCRVLSVSDIFTDHDCYQVTFSNGEAVVADAGHLWNTSALVDNPGRGPGNNHIVSKVRTRTTKEISETLFRHDGARNHSVSIPAPLDLPRIPLPIPPYTLGAWLGDGDNRGARITCADEEIMENIAADGLSFGKREQKAGNAAWSQAVGVVDRAMCIRGHNPDRLKENGRCLDCERENDHRRRNGTPTSPITRLSLTERLRERGLLHNKHIPQEYFRASILQRLSLLQGLMDTDGSISKSGNNLVFTSANKTLSTDVGNLLSTLGIKYSLIPRSMKCNRVAVDGKAWIVQFMAFRDELPVFRLKRKLDRMRLRSDRKNARSKTVQIVAAKKTESVPVKCIVVDSPDHQFLFGKTMLPTHNSGMAAGIMMTALILNWRESAEFFIIAPTVEVAGNSFKPSCGMISSDEDLSDLMYPQEHYRQITHRNAGATLKIVAAESDTVGGLKGVGILVEELWLFGKRPAATNIFTEVTGGLAARPEGFVIWLTTQSDEAPAGVYADKLEYARGVRDGKIDDPAFLPIIYEFPKDMVEKKLHLVPKNFYIPNPNLGASVDEDFLKREFKKAEVEGPQSMQSFLAKHLNIQIATSMKAQRWAGADFWDAAAGEVTLDLILEKSDVIEIGGDGGGLDDLLGLTVLGRDAETGVWYWWSKAWCHAIALERRKSEAPKYHDFAKDGDLIIIDEIGQDVKQFGDIVRKCDASGLLDRIGVDPAGIGAIIDELEGGEKDANGNYTGVGAIEHERIVGISQGWRMNSAIKTTERKVAEKTIIHSGSRMMQWCVGNARVEPKGNAILITKQASGTGKIDPLMAGLSAVALMAMNPEAKRQKSVYEGMTAEEIKQRMMVG
ncbi:MAG: terminase TerL endonuclease subunit [Bacteroidales bacterium]